MARTVWENEERGEQECRYRDHGELQQKGETRLIARRLPEARQLDCINCQGLQAELDRGTLEGGGRCLWRVSKRGRQSGRRTGRQQASAPNDDHTEGDSRTGEEQPSVLGEVVLR